MPIFKDLIKAENYGEYHYLKPVYNLTIHNNWKVEEGYGKPPTP